MIVVSGASGQLGRSVIERLLDRVSDQQIAASVRDPAKVADLARRGVRVRRGDFTDPAGLVHAFEGATQVLLVAVNSTGPERVRQHRAAIDAAVAAGAGRVVYTSHAGASPTSPFPPMPDHFATEEALAESGIAYTALHNGFYASTVPLLLRGAPESGQMRLPEAGPFAWTAHADLADATAIALARGGLDGVTPPLTGPESLDMTDVAALASEITGHHITYVPLSDEDYRANLLTRGVPEAAATMLLGMFAASRRGDFAVVDPTLSRVIERPATSLADVVRSHLGPTPVVAT